MNSVTINTDASFDDYLKIGTFAYWIRDNVGKRRKVSKIKEASDINECEIKAILNALSIINPTKYEFVVVNTDSQTAIDVLTEKNYSRKYKSLLSYYKSNYKNTKIYFKKIKSHSGTDNPRKYVNDWCDKESRNLLNEIRKKRRN